MQNAFESLMKYKTENYSQLTQAEKRDLDYMFQKGISVFMNDYFYLEETEGLKIKEDYEENQRQMYLATFLKASSVGLFFLGFYLGEIYPCV